MYARSVTFQARPETIDDGIAYVEAEGMPTLTALEGCTGVSMICERGFGRCIITSAWSTKEARDYSEQVIAPQRVRGAEIFGAQASVDYWDIAVNHRHAPAGEGACVRCTWLSVDPARITDGIDTYRMTLLPALEELDGFCSTNVMVDRAMGRAVSSTTFANGNALAASRKDAQGLRSLISWDVGATVTDIEEFDLALAHLHVPEMV
jgi:hypothetical protein